VGASVARGISTPSQHGRILIGLASGARPGADRYGRERGSTLSNQPKTPAQVRRTLRSVAWRRGAVKRHTKPSMRAGLVWWLWAFAFQADEAGSIPAPRSRSFSIADSPTGCGNRIVTPDALRSSRRSAANFRPLMRQVSQPGCLPGESGSLPLVVANQRPVSSDVKSIGPTNRTSQALNLHRAPNVALDGDGPRRDCNPRATVACLVRLQDAAPSAYRRNSTG
jgi:hypothetical protein